MVPEHASPLALLGGVAAGGQNVHVVCRSTELGQRGGEVTVYTQRNDPRISERIEFAPGVSVEHVARGRRPDPGTTSYCRTWTRSPASRRRRRDRLKRDGPGDSPHRIASTDW